MGTPPTEDRHYGNIVCCSQVLRPPVNRDACIIFGLSIDWSRLPEGEAKQKLIKAVDKCSTEIPLGLCLKEIGLSTSRYYLWRKLAVACQLSDVSSCPKLKPSKLTPNELSEMKELVTSPAFAHFSIRALSWLAKRTCSVFASATTWGRQIKAHKWLRPRIRRDLEYAYTQQNQKSVFVPSDRTNSGI